METYSSVEIRTTVRFLCAKRYMSTEIDREILAMYGPHAVQRIVIMK